MNQLTGIRRVVRDVADLFELQLELLAADSKELTRRSSAAIAMVLIALVFGLAGVTAATFALAWSLHESAAWTISSSLIAAAGIAALIAGILVILAWHLFKKAASALNESRGEFTENLRWIKAAIVSPEILPTAQRQEASFNGRRESAGRE